MMRFRSFRSRIAFFFLGLVSLVQVVVFLTVDVTNTRHARAQVAVALDEGVLGFRRLVEQRGRQLGESVRILTDDFAFKSALATNDVPTIQSVLENHSSRVGADVMLFVSLQRTPVADSGAAQPRPLSAQILKLLAVAEESGRAAGAITFDGKPYQMILLPASVPFPVGWIATGFEIDDRLAKELRQFTQLETSFLAPADGAKRVFASTLPEKERADLARTFSTIEPRDAAMISMSAGGEEYLSRSVPLGGQSNVEVVVQRSLAKELKPFEELRLAVLLLSFGGLALSLFGALFIARTVTRPVLELAAAAREVERGVYARPVEIRQQDELGELASAFNRMTRGLIERDRVRSLLGKVVSPEIAEKLLSREVELGGEEREITVLFSDLRGFTRFSESRSAQRIVEVLNAYFTRVSSVIEAHGGVVDKYLGDGVMALFGAPVSHEDDAGNALAAAVAMLEALEEMNRELAGQGLPPLDMGIGVNTAVVVAGNLGSPNRLNYTVIGDGVNLASRLEGLTKREDIDARIVAAEATVRKAKRQFELRPLGPMMVRGRDEQVTTYAILGLKQENVTAA